MKKRLLSAALALAMALTMLPLSALPAFAATSDGDTVAYYAANRVRTSASSTAPDNSAGWYHDTGTKTSDNKGNIFEEVTSGVIIGTGTSGKWYTDANTALETGRATSIKLLADGATVDVSKATGTSLTIDLNGHTLTLSGNLTKEYANAQAGTNTTLTSLSIQNSVYANEATKTWPVVSGTTITAKDQNFSYTAKNTSNTGTGPAITLESGSGVNTARTLTVSLTDATVGALTVGNGSANVRVSATTKGSAKTGAITVNGTLPTHNVNLGSTSISVDGGEVGALTLNGKGTVTLTGAATASGDITLFGGQKGQPAGVNQNSLPVWGGAWTVNVGSQCVTQAIKDAANNQGSITVNVTGGSGSTAGVGSIDLTKNTTDKTTAHTVKVDGGTTGAINLNAGTLTIGNGADTGAVTLGEGGKITATISGSTTTVGAVNGSTSKDITLNITGGTVTSVNLPAGYAKHTITGGTFSTAITDLGWLGSVNYQIKSNNLYTYTSSFQDCVDAYKSNNQNEITVVGATNSPFDISFILDAPADATTPDPVVVIKTDASHGITLPDKINNKPVTTWYIGDTNEPKNAGALMSFTQATSVKATTSSADNSEIVSVKVADDDTNGGLSASLVGNTIQVSGALPSTSNGFVSIKLKVKTALGNEYDVAVSYAVTEKKLVAGSQSAPFAAGADNASIQVVGTSLIYPLDGSRLTVSAGGVEPIDLAAATAESTVSITLSAAEKAELKAALDKITADFSGSPAVQEAVNKVVAGLSQTQVDNYIRQGRIAAWRAAGNTGTPNETDINNYSAYNTLYVVVYLDIRATAWNRAAGQESMTLNITPYYKLAVGKTGSYDKDDSFVVKTGSTLAMTGLTSEYGEVEIDLTELIGSGNLMSADVKWAHHGNYVYEMSSQKFTTTHGFSPFVLNKVDPVASVTKTDGSLRGYYDSVQTAIDDTEEGDTVALYTKYDKTAETYSFSGKARTITFNPGINGTFTPTFSGANVTADKTNGNVWTVQLNADTAPVSTRVTVNTANNGTATVNTTTATPGATVSGTYTANSGYKAGTFTAVAQPGSKSVSVSVTANGTFTFTVPSDATSVAVTPSFVLDTGLPFPDVPTNAWYFDGVKYCYETTVNGVSLMQGYETGYFGPDHLLTRAEVVTILWNMSGNPAPGTATKTFTDVRAGSWYYNAVTWAANNGFADGYGNGRFGPDDYVERAELAEFLWKYQGRPTGTANLNNYYDGGNVAAWSQASMRWAVSYGVLSGRNSVALNGYLYPGYDAYRCEVAVTLMQYYRNFRA